MKLNLHLAHLFYTVVREQGFSRAAQTLHISQSAVSKAVKELEHQLGLALIERSGPGRGQARAGLRLTPSGQSFYTHLQGVFALAHAALEDVQAHRNLRQGTLAVGASTTVAAYWLPPLLARYRRDHPHIALRVTVGNTQTIRAGLLDCQMDLALVEGEVNHADIVASVWREEPLVVVTAPDLRTDDPAMSTWLVRETGSGTRDAALRLLHAHGIQPERTVEIGSNEGIARAAAHGLGRALLPQCLVQDLLTLGRLCVVPLGVTNPDQAGMETLRRPLYRLHHAKRPWSPAAQAFSTLLEGGSA